MTPAGLDRIARHAAATHWSRSVPYADRHAAAWSAAAEALCSAPVPPTEDDLLRAARTGISAMVTAARQFEGLSRLSGFTEVSSRFARYWYQPPLSGWEDAIVERIALGQVMGALSPDHQRVIKAYAECDGDRRAAARMAGVTREAFRKRLDHARREFRVLWHEGETPSRQRGRDRRTYRAAVRDAA